MEGKATQLKEQRTGPGWEKENMLHLRCWRTVLLKYQKAAENTALNETQEMEIVAVSFLKRSSCVNRLKAPVKGALKEKKKRSKNRNVRVKPLRVRSRPWNTKPKWNEQCQISLYTDALLWMLIVNIVCKILLEWKVFW